MEPITVKVKEACRLTSLSKTTIFKLLKDGVLRGHRVGRSTLIEITSIRELFPPKEAESGITSCNPNAVGSIPGPTPPDSGDTPSISHSASNFFRRV